MKISRTVRLFLVLAVAILLTRSTAEACQCGPKPPPCDAYGHSSVVFIGFVNSVKNIDRGYVSQLYRLRVEEVFLGNLTENVEAVSSHDSCGFEFKEGKRYLIYADGESKDPYFVTYCSRTQPIESAEDDLTFLREQQTKLNARINLNMILDAQSYYALPKEKRDLPIGGVRATIEGPLVSIRGKMEAQGKPLEFVSDENGFIEASNLTPGVYTVGIIPPEGTRIIPSNRPLFPNNRQFLYTNGRGCSKVSFVIGFTNQK